MEIRIDDLRGMEIALLLEQHLQDMRTVTPPESVHALDLEGLRVPEITFWTVWKGTALAGCGALKELDSNHGEIKSMRTAPAFRNQGVASLMLRHLIEQARNRCYTRLSLETGSMAFFEPARRLYRKFGFETSGPFSDYIDDPNSVFMTKQL
ncbi:MAG: GNAT family N-acetyltransferase [Acidobacteria bacterium]|nr:GNAT family N-acetyltransferase [Acidobacteriota bacterium]